ncbi:MAG: GEVED domain-containing protein [Flavipsychrobacter sp.]
MKSRLLQYAMLLAVTSFFSNNILAQCSTTSPPPTSYCWDSDAIVSLTLGGVTTTPTPNCGNSSTGYTFYSTPVRSLVKGTTVSWTTTHPGVWTEGIAIWIDFNNDGVYSSSEEVAGNASNSSTSISGTFTVPTTATAASNVRMRVRCQYNPSSTWGNGANDACGGYTWGETEDYLVNICDAITVSAQPQNSMGCQNKNASFSVTASGAGGYQWQIDNGSGFTDITNNSTFSGATTSMLSINGLPASIDGANVRCIMSSSCSASVKDTSDPATVTVIANAKVNKQTGDLTTCEKIQTKFGVSASGAISGYKWQVLQKGAGSFVDVVNGGVYSGATSDSLAISQIPASMDGAILRCIVSSACEADTSDSIRVVVQPLPKVVKDPPNVSVIHGSDALFVIEAQGLNLTYRWQAGYQGVYSFINNNAIYSGVDNDSLKVASVSEAQNGFTYRCIISGKGNCAADPDTSSVAILNVLPPLNIANTTTKNSIQLYPNPASGNEITVTINNATKDLNYKIINTVGKTVYEGQLPNTANHNKTISIDGLSSGVYTFQVTNKNGTKISSIQFSKL